RRNSTERKVRCYLYLWTRADDEEDLRPSNDRPLPRPSKPRKSLQGRRRNMCALRNRTLPRLPRWTRILRERAQRNARVRAYSTRPVRQEGPIGHRPLTDEGVIAQLELAWLY